MKVPAGHVWFWGGQQKWMPVLVFWSLKTGRSFEIRHPYLRFTVGRS